MMAFMQTCVDPITEAPGSAVGLPQNCHGVLDNIGQNIRPEVDSIVGLLPQTGVDAWIYLVTAVALIVLGAALYRFAGRF